MSIQKLFNDEKINEAAKLQQISVDIIEALAEKGAFFSALRHAMRIQGMETGEPRLPLQILKPDERKLLERKLEALKVLS